jgi:hypothetical protein
MAVIRRRATLSDAATLETVLRCDPKHVDEQLKVAQSLLFSWNFRRRHQVSLSNWTNTFSHNGELNGEP